MIELRVKEGWGHKYEEVLDLRTITFMGGRIIESKPHFMYTFDVDEIQQRILLEDESEIIDESTSDGSLLTSTYAVTLARHTEPDIELTGHYWEVVEFQCISQLKQII